MNYDRFSYLYPPRPERAVHPKNLDSYDDGTFIAQPKLNGDCAVIFTNGEEVHIRDRHKDSFSKNIRQLDAIAALLHRGTGWIVLVGEWMSKSKTDSAGENFNGNLVLFDVLVYNGVHLSEYSFEDRHRLLADLYVPLRDHDAFIWQSAVPFVYVVKSFLRGFMSVYDEMEGIDMYEGLVLKKRTAKLELGISEKNNSRTQVKFRKPAKNYHY